jgi:hypothetical protein
MPQLGNMEARQPGRQLLMNQLLELPRIHIQQPHRQLNAPTAHIWKASHCLQQHHNIIRIMPYT